MFITLFDQKIKIYFFLVLSLFLLSFFSYLYLPLQAVIWWIIFIVTLVISWRNISNGLLIIFAELFVGGQGHLFNWHLYGYDISIRIGIFCAVYFAFIYQIKKFRGQKWQQSIWFYLFILCILLGIIKGIINNNISSAFLDFNNYLFILIFPIINYIYDRDFLAKVVKILIASINALTVQSLLLLYAFAHQLSWLDLGLLYKWVRDLRLYEITYVADNYYRIFSPSQIYAVVCLVIMIIIGLLVIKKEIFLKEYYYYIISFVLASTLLLISFSRSNWLSYVVIVPIIVILFFIKQRANWSHIWKALLLVFSTMIISVFFIFSWTGSWQGSIIENRISNLTEEAASSRQAQFKPLLTAISQQPITGYGFGKMLTYQSADPRIKNTQNPAGNYTTSAFELGYLDIWLKIGFIGLLLYFLYLYFIIKPTLQNTQFYQKKGIYILGFNLGLLAILIINIFSPYLNHPLGLGLILLASVNHEHN